MKRGHRRSAAAAPDRCSTRRDARSARRGHARDRSANGHASDARGRGARASGYGAGIPARLRIPLTVHAATEPALALLFAGAPCALRFDAAGARALSVVLGVAVRLVGVTTRWSLSLRKAVPLLGQLPGDLRVPAAGELRAHRTGDLAIGAVALLAPFVLGFSGDKAAATWFVVIGAAALVTACCTRWAPPVEVADVRLPRRGYAPFAG